MIYTKGLESNSLTSAQLIGLVAAHYLSNRIKDDDQDGSTARFKLDQLTSEQTAAVARAILDNEYIAKQIDIKLPYSFLVSFIESFKLPNEVLTTERATYLRNAHCQKSALLLANIGDDESQSLQLIESIGSPELLSQPSLWIEVISQYMTLNDGDKLYWERALKGLIDLNIRSLDHIAKYILQTAKQIHDEGFPLLNALGIALPALAIPRDTTYFIGIPERFRTYASRWKKYFNDVDRKRAPYLRKHNSSQLLLNKKDLRYSFDKVSDTIPDKYHKTIENFIEANSGWNLQAQALAECEWEEIKPLFDGLKREKLNLGQLTQTFFEEGHPDLLLEDEQKYLEQLTKRRTSEASEEDQLFYEAHHIKLKEDRKLKSAWEKFIFGTPIETEDFLSGIALCMERLFASTQNSTNRRLRIRLDKTKRDLKDLNMDAGLYFASRYKGIIDVFSKNTQWDVGEIFNYNKLVEEWKQKPNFSANRSESKAALQLKFTLELEVDQIEHNGVNGSEIYSTQLVWKFNPNNVIVEFTSDWERLIRHPLVMCSASRDSVSSKGKFQSVDLYDIKTFVPEFNRDRGSFVAAYKAQNNISAQWIANLETAYKNELITRANEVELKDKWHKFNEVYSNAVKGFWNKGLACAELEEQAKAYALLLEVICINAKGDRNRELLLRPILRIGSVSIKGGPPTEIIAPWHPLRLAAMSIKAHRVANLINHLLTTSEVRFGDTGRLFFKDLKEELEHPFYPEVVLGWHDRSPELLSLSDTCADYSLHESPQIGKFSLDETSENPTEASKRITELVDRYLKLHPHESANLSVVLYNCDSARLPQVVVDRIGAMHEDNDDIRCQIVLRHRDQSRLRQIYESIIGTSDNDPDAYSASEATRDFMARLRIGIAADQAPTPTAQDGPPNDIVFSQDVISRHAKIEWYSENARPVPLENLVPAQWSRRRPAARDDMKSVVYLCCPAQSKEGWAYLTAITSFIKGDWDGNEEKRLLPARQLDFSDSNTRKIFEETHNLGNWVVNYDELLDRRQLLNQQVRVIRYKQSSTQGRNVIISSTARLGLLRSMVLGRVKSLNLGLSDSEERILTERFINDANDISGDIVLRAAKRGRNASELIGIVLSRFLIKNEVQDFLGKDAYFGWYFLDDYADWLGQKEEQIADILMLSPSRNDEGKFRLSLVVSESKFISYNGFSGGVKNSKKQLCDTLIRINEAIFGTPERIDRSLWLGRLSDLLLDGVQFPASSGINLSDWRRAIREGECDISVRGYSHVFISGPSDAPDCSDFITIQEMNNGYQEIYDRAKVRELVLNYHNNKNPMPIRLSNEGPNVWDEQVYRRPSNLTEIHLTRQVNFVDFPTEQKDVSVKEATSVNSKNAINDISEIKSPTSKSNQVIGDIESYSWAYPSIKSLITINPSTTNESIEDAEWLKSIESRTKAALQGFSLQAKLIQSKLTPNAALLKFQGSSNLTVEQVLRKMSEFKTTYGLGLISVQPEPGLVALSIERPIRQIIRLEDLWKKWHPVSKNGNQALVIATREDNGELLILSPQKNAPHTLIAGSTGSGKSVLMQNIILGIAATNTPSQAKIILIDPKLGVDYFSFEALPHIKGGIIDNQEKALEELEALVGEMDRRYRLFKDARTSNLSAYNQKIDSSEHLPVIWLIHDEFAEWMLIEQYKQQVTAIVGRLGVKARAAGIYLIFAAQRPDANVMPMQLRANLGNRLILRVDSEGTSEIALGIKGAERLLGKGHLLAKLEGEANLIFGQVPYVDENIADNIVQIIKE
jgi:S-DNA-T family DNA segregation ATPase FtsK/SpoIIIE